jgi:hypothetical protein
LDLFHLLSPAYDISFPVDHRLEAAHIISRASAYFATPSSHCFSATAFLPSAMRTSAASFVGAGVGVVEVVAGASEEVVGLDSLDWVILLWVYAEVRKLLSLQSGRICKLTMLILLLYLILGICMREGRAI